MGSSLIQLNPPEKSEAIRNLRDEFGFPQEFWPFFQALEDASEEKAAAYQSRLNEINKKFPAVNVKDFVDHIDHVVRLTGLDHVGISSDFYLSDYSLEGWRDASESLNITLELLSRGYTEEEIEKIWSGNLLRVWREVEKVAKTLQESESH